MEKKEKQQFSFSTYEAYKKIRKNDPLKILYESIGWSFINSEVKGGYYKKESIYSPVSLFKAQLLIYLGEAKSNRDLAEKLRFNTKYCVLCGFHHFLKTPAHSTFSAFRKRIGNDLFYKIMQRIIAQSVPIIFKKFPDISPRLLHITLFAKDDYRVKCNCKGKCKFDYDILKDNKVVGKKNYVSSGFKVKLYFNKKTKKPFAAELRPK
jgi:transposase